jgi:hypothetical protein
MEGLAQASTALALSSAAAWMGLLFRQLMRAQARERSASCVG